jgi:hypothetical protein
MKAETPGGPAHGLSRPGEKSDRSFVETLAAI